MRKKVNSFIVAGLAAVMVAGAATAALSSTPGEIKYQGVLRERGALVTGTKSMEFRIFNQETGGSAVWESDAASVDVTQGVFHAMFEPSGINWGEDGPYWLEVVVENTALSPREKIGSTVYALHAAGIDDGAVTYDKLSTEMQTEWDAFGGGELSEDSVGAYHIMESTITDVNIAGDADISWSKISKTGSSLADLDTRSADDLNKGTLPEERLSGYYDIEVSSASYAESAGVIDEEDPVFTAHPAYEITESSTTIWNEAYGWGDHSDEGYLTEALIEGLADAAAVAASTESLSGRLDTVELSTSGWSWTYDRVLSSAAAWDAAHGWGDHGTEGYLKDYTETDPVFSTYMSTSTAGLSVSTHTHIDGNVGIGKTDPALKLDVDGPARFSGASVDEEGALVWDSGLSAYQYYDGAEWQSLAGGNITVEDGVWELDGTNAYYDVGNVGIGTDNPEAKLDVAGEIKADNLNISEWNDAHSWGNHSEAGYMNSEHDAYDITGSSITNWNEAYNWGDHAEAEYLEEMPDHIIVSTVTANAFISDGPFLSDSDIASAEAIEDGDLPKEDGWVLPVMDDGVRMLWYPRKAAFRAGGVFDEGEVAPGVTFEKDIWNDENIGVFSFAAGAQTKASGPASVALGFNTTASGDQSVALGTTAEASGDYSFVYGFGSVASGEYSIAIGPECRAKGDSSVAIGSFAVSKASGAFTIGTGECDDTKIHNNQENSFKAWFENGYNFTGGDAEFEGKIIASTVTADAFYGDGSNLDGIEAEIPDHITVSTITAGYGSVFGEPDAEEATYITFEEFELDPQLHSGVKGPYLKSKMHMPEWENARGMITDTLIIREDTGKDWDRAEISFVSEDFDEHLGGIYVTTKTATFMFPEVGTIEFTEHHTNFSSKEDFYFKSKSENDAVDVHIVQDDQGGGGNLFVEGAIEASTVTANAFISDGPFLSDSDIASVENILEGTLPKEDGWVLPVMDEGVRMLWYPRRAAFRVGGVLDHEDLEEDIWNDENIGNFSVGAGGHTMASGFGSVAMGFATIASGSESVAFGHASRARGDNSLAFGFSSKASGLDSIAIGDMCKAEGEASVAIGRFAKSLASGAFTIASTDDEEYGESTTNNKENSFKAWFENGYRFTGGDAEFEGEITSSKVTALEGVVLRSPDDTKWVLTVDDEGNLNTEEIVD